MYACMHMSQRETGTERKKIYYGGLWTVVQIVQQWLSPKRKAKDPLDWCWSLQEVLQSCQFSVSAGIPKYVLTSAKQSLRHRIDGRVSKSEGKQAKAQDSLFHVSLCGLESVAQS